ncbi:hypothetical protein HF1_04640 [Mycoplasma haemofelis str. Langford 1]|uniref:Uncharacterized protein n=1 Tax=Mycoplasma haemofelis (strain Langford 1) TaxID=941640 RepID=E8ZH51_MYCHL|nr:hypothetical protein [Mycoplasma haemofelis]CBY92472.1 hypothetical protein HF1_04640 [Mycoplasma haemofelis str. Langford 1]
MTPLTKGAIAAAASGIGATGAYAGSLYLSNKTTIASQLTKDGHVLISSITNKEHSKQQWEAEFESDEQNIKTLIGFNGNGKVLGGTALEEWCSSKLKENYSETYKDLKGIKSYCVVRSITSQLSRKGTSVLTESSGDSTKWSSTYGKRKTTPKKTPRSQIEGLEGTWSQSHEENKDLEKIKAWCNKKSQALFYAHESTYDQVYNWCTEGGAKIEEASTA